MASMAKKHYTARVEVHGHNESGMVNGVQEVQEHQSQIVKGVNRSVSKLIGEEVCLDQAKLGKQIAILIAGAQYQVPFAVVFGKV